MSNFYGPRHGTIDKAPELSHRQASENARDTQEALDRKVSGHFAIVSRYTATGDSTQVIRLEASARRPLAVILVHAAPVGDPSSPLNPIPGYSFAWDATTKSLDVYEPFGLDANVIYTLTYLVLEA